MVELLHPEWSAEKIEKLKGHYEAILSLLGEDVEREGLLTKPVFSDYNSGVYGKSCEKESTVSEAFRESRGGGKGQGEDAGRWPWSRCVDR